MSNISLNTVRYYTDADVYHYTVDNRPLQDLASNDQILLNAIQSLSASIGAGMYSELFISGSNFTPGTSTTLTLLSAPPNAAGVWVFFDGIYQNAVTYTINNTTVTFSSVIPLGVATVEVKWTTTLLGGGSGGGGGGGAVTAGVASLAANATDGFFSIPQIANTPTGTPGTQTGYSPIVFDSTNTKLWVWTGTAWKGVVLS